MCNQKSAYPACGSLHQNDSHRIDVVSIFPEVVISYMDASMMGRAQARGFLQFAAHDLRRWTHDLHRTVDDEPYGGGHGMLMKCQPVFEALDEIIGADEVARRLAQAKEPSTANCTDCKPHDSVSPQTHPHVIFFSPCGKPFTQKIARELAQHEHLVMVCGRYEGIDERAYVLADEVISLGDYVLTGGELAALVVSDAVVRLYDGVLGDDQSACDESFSDEGLLEYAQYTRPATYRGLAVPPVLLSGNHALISQFKRDSSLERTHRWRPDLLSSRETTNMPDNQPNQGGDDE